MQHPMVRRAKQLRNEVRADHAVTALDAMSAPAVRVRRNGVEVSVPSAVIVPGDRLTGYFSKVG